MIRTLTPEILRPCPSQRGRKEIFLLFLFFFFFNT